MALGRYCVGMIAALILFGCSQTIRWKFINSGGSQVTIRINEKVQTVRPGAESGPLIIVNRDEIVEIVEDHCRYRFLVPLGTIPASETFEEALSGNLGKTMVKLELSSSKELVATLIDNPSADVGLGFPLKSMAGCETVAPE